MSAIASENRRASYVPGSCYRLQQTPTGTRQCPYQRQNSSTCRRPFSPDGSSLYHPLSDITTHKLEEMYTYIRTHRRQSHPHSRMRIPLPRRLHNNKTNIQLLRRPMPEYVMGRAVQKHPGALVRDPAADLAFLELPIPGIHVGNRGYGSVVDVAETLQDAV